LRIKVAHGLLPWKIVWVLFLNWVLIWHPIFWEIKHFENSKRMELIKRKRKVFAKERKRKGDNDFGFFLLPKKNWTQ